MSETRRGLRAARLALLPLLLSGWLSPEVARAGCTDVADVEDFRSAVHRELVCSLLDTLMGDDGCAPRPVPECAEPSLARLAELVPGGVGDRLLARWGSEAAQCREALAHGAEQYLHDRVNELRKDQRATRATRRLRGAGRACSDVEVGQRAPLGGPCAGLAEPGALIDGARLRRCLGAALEGIAQEVASRPIRPNIVLILTDDQRWDTLEYMPLTREYVSDRGVEFRDAFVTTSLCCPDRATILTGQYAHHHGVLNNRGAFEFDDSDTLPIWLRDAGYRTALFGKYMNNTGRALRMRIPPGWDEWQVFTENHDLYVDYPLNENGTIVRHGRKPQDYSTDLLARRVVEFIEANADAPFFAMFAPFAPHPVPLPARRHRGRFATLPNWRPPSWREPDLRSKPAYVYVQREIGDVEGSEKEVDGERSSQLETLLAVDEAVEQISKALQKLGLEDNTLLVFTSDNGFMWNEHWLRHKNYPYEEAIRVPLLVRYPLLSPLARRSDELVLHMDLAPTFTELAGAPAPPDADGRSLVPLIAGTAVAWREDFMIEHFVRNLFTVPTEGVRTRHWKYIETDAPVGVAVELYDLEADPYELVNRAEDAELAETRERLVRRLRELRAE